MKISKYLWVDHQMKWGKWQRMRLQAKHSYKGHGYAILVSEQESWLFEIIPTSRLSNYYANYYMVGLVHSKKMALEFVAKLVDEIYNKKERTYASLKQG